MHDQGLATFLDDKSVNKRIVRRTGRCHYVAQNVKVFVMIVCATTILPPLISILPTIAEAVSEGSLFNTWRSFSASSGESGHEQ